MQNLTDTLTLNNGYKIPCIGFGTWKIPSGETCIKAIYEALDTGYRHIDTAEAYENQASIGEAIAYSGIPRESIFLTSKVWNEHRGYDLARIAFEDTLFELQTDYLDLYLIHWPAVNGTKEEWTHLNAETWRALEDLYSEGRIRAIGVSNFEPHHLEPLLETARIKPMVNQIEFHPGFPQTESRAYCDEHDILVEAWSPLGNGKLLNHPYLIKMAAKYSCTVAQLCVRWCLQNHTLPLVKSVSPERMKENADVFGIEISLADMLEINTMSQAGFSGLDPDATTIKKIVS